MERLMKLLGVAEEDKELLLGQIKEAIRFNRKNDQLLKVHERLTAVKMLLQGKPMGEVSEAIDKDRSTIYNYAGLYREAGIDGLVSFYGKGSQPRLSPDQEKMLADTIESKTPCGEGLGIAQNWTSPLIAKWVEKAFGVLYSDRGIRNLLERIGFSYASPTHSLAKSDPVEKTAFKRSFEDFKKNF